MPAVGYDHPDQSHFVSRHFYEVGALDPQTTTGWLGRYLDRVGSPENPLQGLALDNSLAPALAARRVPVAAVDAPTDYDFWARDVWGDIEPIMLDATARIGVVHQRAEPALAQVAGAAMHTGALRWQLAGAARGRRQAPASRRPVTYPVSEESDFPRAARRARGDARRRPAAALRRDHRARRLRHAREPGRDARRAADARLRRARRVPARPRGARPGRPRAGPRLVGVRPPRGRELRGHRPRRRGARAADRHARRRADDRRVPGPRRARRARQPACDVRLPRRLRRAARAVARDRGRRDHPRRRARSRGRSWSSDRRARRRARAWLSPPRRRADAGHRRRVVARQLAPADRGGQARDPALQPRRGRARPRRRGAARAARRTFRIAETRPGQLGEATWRLKPGRYRLWCDLPGHRAAGMRASLRVRR